jgi:hypothetical protein
MEVVTIRLDKQELEELDDEAGDYDCTRSEYIRLILRNRDSIHPEHTDHTSAHEQHTGDHKRIRNLEHGLARLERTQTGRNNDEAELLDSDADASRDEYHTREVVTFVRENQPVERRVIMAAFEDEFQIKPRSWWDRHARPALDEAGAEFIRNHGWQFPEN